MGREHCPLLSGPQLPQGVGTGALQGPRLGAARSYDLSTKGEAHFPGEACRGHCGTEDGRCRGGGGGLVGGPAHHLNCFRKMFRFRLFLESRNVIWRIAPPRCWYLRGHRGPRPAPAPAGPHLLGLLPGRGGHVLLGLGLGEAEQPLDAGEVGLHGLGSQAAQRGPHGAVLCGAGAPVRLTHAPGRRGQAGPAKEALQLLSPRVHAYGCAHVCVQAGGRPGLLAGLSLDRFRPSTSTRGPGPCRGCGISSTSQLTRVCVGGEGLQRGLCPAPAPALPR